MVAASSRQLGKVLYYVGFSRLPLELLASQLTLERKSWPASGCAGLKTKSPAAGSLAIGRTLGFHGPPGGHL